MIVHAWRLAAEDVLPDRRDLLLPLGGGRDMLARTSGRTQPRLIHRPSPLRGSARTGVTSHVVAVRHLSVTRSASTAASTMPGSSVAA
jgi:hypothetical protein